MDLIGSFLTRYKKINDEDLEVKNTICQVINTQIKTNLKPEDLTIKNYVLSLPVSSILKSEIFMRKATLLAEINKDLSVPLVDIR